MHRSVSPPDPGPTGPFLTGREHLLGVTFHHSPDALVLTRLEDGKLLEFSDGFLQITGYAREEVLGRSTGDLGLWVDPQARAEMVSRLAREESVSGLQVRFRRKDGSVRQGLLTAWILREAEERILFASVKDVTALLDAERALRESEERFAGAFQLAPTGLALTRYEDGRIVAVNATVLEDFGYTEAEMVGKLSRELGTWVEFEDRRRMLEALAVAGEVRNQVVRFRRKSGSVFQALYSARKVEIGGEPHVLVAYADLSSRLEAERIQKENQALFESVFEAGLDAMALADLEGGAFLAVNAAFERLSGRNREELLDAGLAPDALWVEPASWEDLRRELQAAGRVADQERAFRRKDGETLIVLLSAGVLQLGGKPRILATARDVTALRRQEEAHRQAQKLESLGLLAGGIAHDFNNLFQALLGNLNLVQMQVPRGAPIQDRLETMERTLHRAEALAKQMLVYAGRERMTQEPFQPDLLVRELADLLEVSLSGKGDLQLDLGAPAAGLLGDPSQLQQVVLNLVVNAAEAYGTGGGRVAVRSRAGALQGPHPPGAFVLAPALDGPHYLLEVEDHGAGMDADTLARIFDPFFSTKAAGRGLGLSAILGILRGHRGAVEVLSAPGAGTTFRVYLPLQEIPAAHEPSIARPHAGSASGWSILLVEDEDEVRAAIQALLEALGCTVAVAANGAEMVRAFAQEPGRFDLVLLDAGIPRQALEAIRACNPQVRAVLTSGYNGDAENPVPAPDGFQGLLKKPFGLRALRELLDGLAAGS